MTKESFSKEALFALVEAMGEVEFFGFPELSLLRLNANESLEVGLEELKHKGLVNEKGSFTLAGKILLKVLARYSTSLTYLMIQQFFIAPDREEAICLEQTVTGYRILVLPGKRLLERIYQENSLVQRVAPPIEASFTMEKLRRSEVRQLELENLPDSVELLSLGKVLHIEAGLEKEEWLFFSLGESLYGVRPSQERVYKVSQYWLTQWLVDELKVAYEVPEGVEAEWEKFKSTLMN